MKSMDAYLATCPCSPCLLPGSQAVLSHPGGPPKLAKKNWDLLCHFTAFLLSPLVPALFTIFFS